MDATRHEWSNLLGDLLNEIGKHLQCRSRNDIARFRAVCETFRSSVPPPPKIQSPYSYLKPPMPSSLNYYRKHILLMETTIYIVEPCLDDTFQKPEEETAKTLLFKVEETTSGKLQIYDLFNIFPYKKHEFQSLNLLDYQVCEISKSYEFPGFNGYCLFGKVVVSENTDDGFLVMAILVGKLCAWRKGDEKWTDIRYDNYDYANWLYVVDVVYHRDKFYAVYEDGRTMTVDPKSFKMTQVAIAKLTGWCKCPHTWLVRSPPEGLFLIDADVSQIHKYKIDLMVYRLDEDEDGGHQWVYVSDLKDKMLFVGDDFSFSLSTKELSRFKGNCVYISGKLIGSIFVDTFGYHVAIFDMENRTFQPASQDDSNIFWPPTALPAGE